VNMVLRLGEKGAAGPEVESSGACVGACLAYDVLVFAAIFRNDIVEDGQEARVFGEGLRRGRNGCRGTNGKSLRGRIVFEIGEDM
jgi:hypothetical protein